MNTSQQILVNATRSVTRRRWKGSRCSDWRNRGTTTGIVTTMGSSPTTIKSSTLDLAWFSSEAATAPNDTSAPPPPPPPNRPPKAPPIVWTTHRLTKEQIIKVDAIFHKILWLDSMETSLLLASMQHKLDRSLTPAQRAHIERLVDARVAKRLGQTPTTSGEEGNATEEVETIKTVDLKLVGFDEAAKIKVIKEVRAIAGLGLKEAKEVVEKVPIVIQKGLAPEKAQEIKEVIEKAGGKVEIV